MSAPNFGMSLELPKTTSQPSSQPQSPTQSVSSPCHVIPKRRFGLRETMRIPSFRSNSNDIETRISLTSNTSYDSNQSDISAASGQILNLGRRSLPRRLSQRTSFPSIQESDDGQNPIGQSGSQSNHGDPKRKSLPNHKLSGQAVLLPVLSQEGSEEEKNNDEVFEP